MPIAVATDGLHPTTESCLEALQWLHARKACHRVLDMGCGNGILSVTAASIWECQVVAADISEKAVADTRNMAENHDLGMFIHACRSDFFSNTLIKNNKHYDLICFNLLARPVMEHAANVKAHLAPGGACILSGILAWEAEDVKAVYRALDFDFIKEFINTNWCTLIACHKTDIRHF